MPFAGNYLSIKTKAILQIKKSKSENRKTGELKMKKLTIIFAAIAVCFGITTGAFAQYVTAEFLTYGAGGTLKSKNG